MPRKIAILWAVAMAITAVTAVPRSQAAGQPTCPDGTIAQYLGGGRYHCAGDVIPRSRSGQQSRQQEAGGEQDSRGKQNPSGTQPDTRATRSAADGLLGTWSTNVAGGVVNYEDLSGTRWQKVFPGAQAGDLAIRADGTYAWASYGGKSGRWEATGRSDYPIALVDLVERKRWLVGLDERRGGQRIYIWDGNSFTYTGRRK